MATRATGIVYTSEIVSRVGDEERIAWRQSLAAELPLLRRWWDRQVALVRAGTDLDTRARLAHGTWGWGSSFTSLLNGPAWADVEAEIQRAARLRPGQRSGYVIDWIWFCHAETVLTDDDLAAIMNANYKSDPEKAKDAIGSMRRRIYRAWPERDLRHWR
jgi:hypothetical protein